MKKVTFIVSALLLSGICNNALASCPPHHSNPTLGNGAHRNNPSTLGGNPSAPPKPKTNPTFSGGHSTHGTEQAPIGTATGLILALGGVALGCKLRKNTKDNEA